MNSILKVGTVIEHKKARGIHNEIVAINGDVIELSQYSKTTDDKKVFITKKEWNYMVRKNAFDVILVR